MKKTFLVTALTCVCGVAHAQQSPTVSIGLRAWQTQWDTFSYDTNQLGDPVVTQAPAKDKLVLLPVLSLRWHDFTGSVSLYPSTDHEFVSGGRVTRKEFDVNVGYFVSPGIALTLGYKKVDKGGSSVLYALSGPVAGVSGTAPLGRDFSLYGSFGMGWMKSTGSSMVKFDADYRLNEFGTAYTMAAGTLVKAVTFTLGYRTQVLAAKEALASQRGRELTQGFTFGALASF